MSVFHQFSTGLGPSGLACSPDTGILYVSRFDTAGAASRGVVSVIDPEKGHVADLHLPAPELTGICISPDGADLFVSEASTGTIFRCVVPSV